MPLTWLSAWSQASCSFAVSQLKQYDTTWWGGVVDTMSVSGALRGECLKEMRPACQCCIAPLQSAFSTWLLHLCATLLEVQKGAGLLKHWSLSLASASL